MDVLTFAKSSLLCVISIRLSKMCIVCLYYCEHYVPVISCIFCAHCVPVTLCIVHVGLCCPLAAPGAPGTCGCRPQEMPPCPLLPNVTSSPDFTLTCAYFMQCLNFTYPALHKSSPDFTQICASVSTQMAILHAHILPNL